jgi:hypothetical protein
MRHRVEQAHLKAARARDAQIWRRELTPPDDEHVAVRMVWLVEVFDPGSANTAIA